MTEDHGLAPAEEVRVELVDRLPARAPWARTARVTQPTLGRDLEMRIFPAGFTEQQAALFFQELRHLSALDHAGFVPVHDSLMYKGCPCYLVQLRDDPTLDQLVAPAALELAERCRVVRSLAEALAAAHAAQVLVGPMLPERVAWSASRGRAYLLHIGQSPEDWRSDFLAGSPVAGAREPLSQANDVLAWGMLSAWLLTGGEPVFPDAEREASPLRLRLPSLAPGLGMAIEAALAREPALRPESGGALRAILASDPQDLAAPGAAAPEAIAIETLSTRVLERGKQWDPKAVPELPEARSRPSAGDLESAFRVPGASAGTDLGKMNRMARGMGLTLLPDGPIPGRPAETSPWSIVRNAALGGLVIGLAIVGLQRGTTSNPQATGPSRATAPTTRTVARRKPLDRPGHAPAAVSELVSHQGDIIPEDFETLWKKLQALVIQDELPAGITDGKSMMRLWIRYKRDPKAACKELQGLLEKLRAKSGG